jgi:hypothetical protein
MTHWRRLSYAGSMAVLLTTLAYCFFPGVGELVAIPGVILAGWIDLILLLVSSGDDMPQVGNWVILSVLFYTVVIYLALWFYATVRGRAGRIEPEAEI